MRRRRRKRRKKQEDEHEKRTNNERCTSAGCKETTRRLLETLHNKLTAQAFYFAFFFALSSSRRFSTAVPLFVSSPLLRSFSLHTPHYRHVSAHLSLDSLHLPRAPLYNCERCSQRGGKKTETSRSKEAMAKKNHCQTFTRPSACVLRSRTRPLTRPLAAKMGGTFPEKSSPQHATSPARGKRGSSGRGRQLGSRGAGRGEERGKESYE